MRSGLDWSAPLGSPGRLEVEELLRPDRWASYFAQAPGQEIELAHWSIAEEQVHVAASRGHRLARVGRLVLADLVLDSGPPGDGTVWEKPLLLLDRRCTVRRRVDREHGSRLRGPLRYLEVTGTTQRWVWHFEGGRVAGERLVLRRGEQPLDGPVLVTVWPSSQSRGLGNPSGGASETGHVTAWSADASPIEVLLAELFATARLDGMVDYRAARVADGLSELLEQAPHADPNAE